MIQIETVFGFAAQNGTLITIFVAIGLGYIIWRRTGSSHLFLSRLWMMIFGKNQCNVPEIQDAIDTQTAVMQFRFITGLRIRTKERAEAVIAWARRHNENIADIAACGPYFDLENPGLKPEARLPKRWRLGALVIATVIFALLLLCSTGAVIFDRAVLRMKQTSTWFILNEEVAKPISDSPGFFLRKCNEPASTLALNSGFTENEVKILCRAYIEKELAGFVNSSIRSQRIIFFCLAIYIGYLLISTLRWLNWGVKAHEVRKRLSVPSADVGQEEHF